MESQTIFKKIGDMVKKADTVKIIVFCGITGMIFLLISTLFADKTTEKSVSADPQRKTADVLLYEYENRLEQNLAEMICSIEGAGSTKVMITMESTAEEVYATNKNVSQKDSNATKQSDMSDNKDLSTQSTYITVELSDGTQQTVLIKEIQPKVRGVLIVCNGGDNEIIKEKVTEAVSRILDISSSKVSVLPLAK